MTKKFEFQLVSIKSVHIAAELENFAPFEDNFPELEDCAVKAMKEIKSKGKTMRCLSDGGNKIFGSFCSCVGSFTFSPAKVSIGNVRVWVVRP